MKKIILGFIIILIMINCAFAEVKVGFLTQLNISEEEYQSIVLSERKNFGWHLMSINHNDGEKFYFYDSLISLLMALNAGEIDEAVFPKTVGEYVLNSVNNLTIASVTNVKPISLAFGFSVNNEKLRDEFNSALTEIKAAGKLVELQEKYLTVNTTETESINFERFNSSEKIRVAVTGDLPPIDYVDALGEPSGFNAAILSEIGKILHKNIIIMNIESGARSAVLASGRADVVFWYQFVKDNENAKQTDVPDGVLLSDAYYVWDKFLYIRKK